LAGYLRWTDYRNKEWPSAIKIEHHKTGVVVWHPLEEKTELGTGKFYEDAEAVLNHLPRPGWHSYDPEGGSTRRHQAVLI
jgi:hypothetical protein